jgi:hypothetical protein
VRYFNAAEVPLHNDVTTGHGVDYNTLWITAVRAVKLSCACQQFWADARRKAGQMCESRPERWERLGRDDALGNSGQMREARHAEARGKPGQMHEARSSRCPRHGRADALG